MNASNDRDSTKTVAWRQRLHEVIFEADTFSGKFFDVILLGVIVLSIVIVMLESVEEIRLEHQQFLFAAEWTFTVLFTVEYLLRLVCVRSPRRYAISFFGVVDLLAILPAYVSLLLPGSHQQLLVIRGLRLLRIFRVFKLARYLTEAAVLRRAVWASRTKITVFLVVVFITVIIMGSTMHLIEGSDSGFTSIPQSMYWAIVTMTTVGYGDIAPITPLGKTVAAVIMILGYCLIIIPTGIVSAELAQGSRGKSITTQACPSCMAEGHDADAVYCKLCGEAL